MFRVSNAAHLLHLLLTCQSCINSRRGLCPLLQLEQHLRKPSMSFRRDVCRHHLHAPRLNCHLKHSPGSVLHRLGCPCHLHHLWQRLSKSFKGLRRLLCRRHHHMRHLNFHLRHSSWHVLQRHPLGRVRPTQQSLWWRAWLAAAQCRRWVLLAIDLVLASLVRSSTPRAAGTARDVVFATCVNQVRKSAARRLSVLL